MKKYAAIVVSVYLLVLSLAVAQVFAEGVAPAGPAPAAGSAPAVAAPSAAPAGVMPGMAVLHHGGVADIRVSFLRRVPMLRVFYSDLEQVFHHAYIKQVQGSIMHEQYWEL